MVHRIPSHYTGLSPVGLRPNRSTIDNLVILSCDVHKRFINNSPTISIFLDIKGAFDDVIPNILIQDLHKIGIPALENLYRILLAKGDYTL